ncbi:hypothetical protein [Streptomyces sp. BPTC-684]|uniref:hypothetical protein n=1 Tax=Streptomyces sp. BPTC-684 TaxID=3043734 RepID=UPI0024B173FD|nr:hypothetical protein [Streptomyces sp. BPTC-684]WHM41148.1 hypothetical protein QIY60_32675 [Streptomyces sp. BPTC-684]
MAKDKATERRLTFQEIAVRGNSSHTRVRKIVAAGILGDSGYQPGNQDGVPEDEGDLIATVLRASVASPTTAQILKANPGMVLEAALALAELARRQLEQSTIRAGGQLNAAA